MRIKPIVAMVSGLMAFNAYASTVIQLDTISVTAAREEESMTEQPLSIAKKGAEEKQLDQAIFQKDVLNSIAGVNINQTGSVLGHKTAIRMPNTTAPYYLFLQDNVPVQSSGFFNHNAMAYTNFQTAGTTEVLKGAGTALYGSDSVAATINVQSAAPAEKLEKKINGYVGSDGFLQGGVSISDTQKDGSSYRISGSKTSDEGWREHTAMERHELSGEYNFSKSEDDFKLSFVSNSSKSEQAGSLIGLDALENNPESIGDIESKLTGKLWPIGLDAIRQFDHNRVSLEWDSYRVKDIDLSTIFYLRNTRNRYTATWEGNLPHNDSEEYTLGVMHKGTMNPSWGRVIYGVDSEVTKGSRVYTQRFTDGSVPAGTIYDYEVDYIALSPYAQSDWNLTQDVTLTAGLRYDMNRFDYQNKTSDGVYGDKYLRPASRVDDYSHLSPKLSLTHQLSPTEMTYARYANSFRVPSASRLYNLKKDNIEFGLEPEISNTIEFGYKHSGKASDVEFALYYMDLADTITKDSTGDFYYNGGTTIHKGVEASLKHEFSPEWAAKAAYSYSMHNFVNHSKYENDEMAEAPNHQLNLRAFYRPKQVSGLLLMVEGIYTSDYWMDNDHNAKYAGYKVYNLKANYQVNKEWRVYAKLNNLTDERYAESASYSSFGGGKEKYTPAAPRQFFVGAELKW